MYMYLPPLHYGGQYMYMYMYFTYCTLQKYNVLVINIVHVWNKYIFENVINHVFVYMYMYVYISFTYVYMYSTLLVYTVLVGSYGYTRAQHNLVSFLYFELTDQCTAINNIMDFQITGVSGGCGAIHTCT